MRSLAPHRGYQRRRLFETGDPVVGLGIGRHGDAALGAPGAPIDPDRGEPDAARRVDVVELLCAICRISPLPTPRAARRSIMRSKCAGAGKSEVGQSQNLNLAKIA